MKLELDKEQFIEELHKNTTKIAKDVQKAAGIKYTDEVLKEATHHIQARLKMASSLPMKGGLRQFYDTQSKLAKQQKGWKVPPNTDDPHLIEMWKVSHTAYLYGGEPKGTIIIENDKQVRGKSQEFSLFELLWKGTDYYVVPTILNQEEVTRLSNASRIEGSKIAPFTITKNKFKTYKKTKYETFKLEVDKKPQTQIKNKTRMDFARESHYDTIHGASGYMGFSGRIHDEEDNEEQEEKAGSMNVRRGITASQTTKFYRAVKARVVTALAKMKMSRGKMREVHDDKYNQHWQENVTYKSTGGKQFDASAKRMHFYNRFTGRFYYNQFMRKGIGDVVVQDFHDYISNCVYKGILDAVSNNQRMVPFDKYEVEREMLFNS